MWQIQSGEGGGGGDLVELSFDSKRSFSWTSRKHAYIMLTPLNSTLYSKTGIDRGIHYSYFCSKI